MKNNSVFAANPATEETDLTENLVINSILQCYILRVASPNIKNGIYSIQPKVSTAFDDDNIAALPSDVFEDFEKQEC